MLINYKSKRWKKLRQSVLRRDRYECQESRRYGRFDEATTVHHIYPVETHPEIAWERWNLVSLSSEAHNRMHERRTHRISETGKQWQDRRRPEYLDWCRKNGVPPHFG